MKMGKNKLIPATAKKDPQMQSFITDDDPVVAALACARLGKKGEDQKLAKLATLSRITRATGGVLPPCLVYFGSHTGRFSGSGGFNIQNLAKSGLGGRTRHLLVPQPGHVFVIADLAQIEARITAWIAGETLLLDAFKNGSDVYSEFASRTFGQLVRKAQDSDLPELRDRLTALREVGKQAVLGLGYQMGALEFVKQLRAKPLVAPLFDTGQLSPSICHQIVRSFRDEYSRISRLWPWLDEAMRHAIGGVRTRTDRLDIDRDGSVTKVWLPSGRALRYENLRLGTSRQSIRYLRDDGMEDEFVPNVPSMIYGREAHIYGGKLCENVVQATARDLLVEAILRLEASGLRVLFHVHDEVVVEVAESDADLAEHTVNAELSHQPSWAPGLPVKCEVQIATHYTK
jgi:DNA polymerase